MKKQSEHIVTKNLVSLKKKYFEDIVKPVFNKMQENTRPIIKTYNIAGKTICFRFYSELLAQNLSRAISHNEINLTGSSGLTINVWDSASTGTTFAPPWINEDYTFEAEVNTKKSINDSFLGIYMVFEQTLSFYDKETKCAWFWVNDARELPYWVTAAPVRTILHWLLSESDIHLLHGAVIGLKEQSILLAARGGSGKSTTALSCLLSGMNYLGDDYVGIELNGGAIAHCLYNSGKVDANCLKNFPELQGKVWNKDNLDNEKAVVFLADLFPEQVISKAKVQAIMIPVIKNSNKTRIVPAAKMQAMLAIAPTTLFQLPFAGTNFVEELKAIIEVIPCYFLELGTNISEIPVIIKSFFNEQQVKL
jgi:hypothetical protein